MKEVAIVGVGCTGFKYITPDVSYKELMFEAAARVYEDPARAQLWMRVNCSAF